MNSKIFPPRKPPADKMYTPAQFCFLFPVTSILTCNAGPEFGVDPPALLMIREEEQDPNLAAPPGWLNGIKLITSREDF